MSVDTSNWPEKPYQWMVNDLRKSLDVGANYLVALGLFTYTEFMGREVLQFRKPTSNRYSSNKWNKKAFNLFLAEYMDYQDLVEQYGDKLYDWFRNGLAHEYHIKGIHSGVYLYLNENAKGELLKLGKDPGLGLQIITQSRGTQDDFPVVKVLLASIYLEHFIRGAQRFLEESGQIKD